MTNALQSIEGDDDSASPGQGTSGEDKNIKDKKQSTKDKRRDEVDKDNNKNNNKTPKPARHATENDPYSPPTFPPTLNDAIKGEIDAFNPHHNEPSFCS